MPDYPDPFGTASPWDANPPTATPVKEKPMTNTQSDGAPFRVGVTLKAGKGYEAPWITPSVSGGTAEEVAKGAAELMAALKTFGVIDLTNKAAHFIQGDYEPGNPNPVRFENGNLVGAVKDDTDGVITCRHGDRTFRSGENSRGTWQAMFCPERDKSSQCPPAWFNKKTNRYEI